jgi:hypothetical protein
MWDIVYGYENNGTRTTNISWRENGTKRLVREDETGYLLDEEAVATLAGCINSTHDLMGKIIENKKGAEDTISAPSASVDKIYYGDFKKNKDGKCDFYIKEACYEYTPSNEPLATEIKNMTQFEKNEYYYTADNDYYLETNDYVYGKNYFNIEVSEALNLIDSYEPGKYYYLHEDNYLVENNDEPDETKTYCEIYLDRLIQTTGIKVNDNVPEQFFKPIQHPDINSEGPFVGYFYMEDGIRPIPINPNGITFSELSGKKCYWVENYTFDVKTQAGTNQEVITYNIHENDPELCQEIRFIEFKIDLNYYSIDENNNLIKLKYDNINHDTIYYQFGEDTKTQIEGLFYESDTYYYTTNGNDYFFAKEPNKIEEVTYHKLSSTPMEVTFY